MRVVAGKYKGRHFDVPRTFKARPTTDFAKENLFNVLQRYLDFEEEPSALDLFAGTGSITLEFLSRGCGRVVSVEKEALHYSFIQRFVEQLQDLAAVPVRGDVFRFLERCSEKFDIVFADPPYQLPRLCELPDLVMGKDILKENGLFVLEHGKEQRFEAHPCFVEHRAYGSVNFTFFQQPILSR